PWHYLIFCVAVSCPFYFFNQFALNVLFGLQRFRTHMVLLGLQTILPLSSAAAVLLAGGDLSCVGATFLASQIVQAVLSAVPLWENLRKVGPLPPERLRSVVKFSGKAWASQVAGTFISQGDRYFIGNLLPISQLGYYSLASSLAQKFNLITG